jgi:urease accessory protein
MLNAHSLTTNAAPSLEIELTYDQRERSRLRVNTTCGVDVGISLKAGTILRHGAVLALSDGRAAKIVAAKESLMEVSANGNKSLAAIAYHIGNRHVPMEAGPHTLRLLPDHVLKAMVEGLGGTVTMVSAPFNPESGAYGHSHIHHSHDDLGHGGRIHDGLSPRTPKAHDPR